MGECGEGGDIEKDEDESNMSFDNRFMQHPLSNCESYRKIYKKRMTIRP